MACLHALVILDLDQTRRWPYVSLPKVITTTSIETLEITLPVNGVDTTICAAHEAMGGSTQKIGQAVDVALPEVWQGEPLLSMGNSILIVGINHD